MMLSPFRHEIAWIDYRVDNLPIETTREFSMLRATKTGLIAVAMTASMLAFAGPAEAVTDFRNCDHMHRTFKNGVARSDAAADRQVRTGHFRPAVRPKVYRANDESDADNDGTACEVTR